MNCPGAPIDEILCETSCPLWLMKFKCWNHKGHEGTQGIQFWLVLPVQRRVREIEITKLTLSGDLRGWGVVKSLEIGPVPAKHFESGDERLAQRGFPRVQSTELAGR